MPAPLVLIYRRGPWTEQPGLFSFWSTRQDSNPQPSALNTAALPLSLRVHGAPASYDPDRGLAQSITTTFPASGRSESKRPASGPRAAMAVTSLLRSGSATMAL